MVGWLVCYLVHQLTLVIRQTNRRN